MQQLFGVFFFFFGNVHSWEECGVVLTHLNAPNQQTDKTSAFMEVLALINSDLQRLACCLPF